MLTLKQINNAFDKKEIADSRSSLREKMIDRKIIFSVDRLDYTKGVHNRLKAYELFLHQNPEYHNKVVFNYQCCSIKRFDRQICRKETDA